MRFLWFAMLLPAQPRQVELLKELVPIRPMESKLLTTVRSAQTPGTLLVNFRARHEGEGVNVALRHANATIAESGYASTGTLRVPVQRGQDYTLILENHRQRLGSAEVELEATLRLDPIAVPRASHVLPPARRWLVVAVSVALFAGFAAYAGVRLGPALAARFRRS